MYLFLGKIYRWNTPWIIQAKKCSNWYHDECGNEATGVQRVLIATQLVGVQTYKHYHCNVQKARHSDRKIINFFCFVSVLGLGLEPESSQIPDQSGFPSTGLSSFPHKKSACHSHCFWACFSQSRKHSRQHWLW